MDPTPTASPTRAPRGRALAAAAALLGLILYAAVLLGHVGATAGGSDSSGYLNHARLLAAGRLHLPERTLPGLAAEHTPPYLYVPLGFRPAPNGQGMVPTYPSGLPLLIAAFSPLVGWGHAADSVLVLHSLAGLFTTYWLGRGFGLGGRSSALAVAMVGLSPLYLFMSLQAMSDLPSLVWTTLAVIAALRSGPRPAWALAAGFALAVDVLLRPANVLVFLPVAAALGASPRRWVLLLLGGLPGALFFAVHSLAAYGQVATTGYGNEILAFRLAYVPETLAHYVLWLPVLLSPLALAAVGLPWARREPLRRRWILALWIIAYGAFYCAYQNTHESWWYLRFLLPAAPALAVAALLVGRAIRDVPGSPLARWPWPRATAAGVVALTAFLGVRFLHPFSITDEESRYGRVARWLQSHLPDNAVCLTKQESGALLYFTHFTFLRWDEVRPGDVPAIEAALRRAGRPLYAVLFQFELAAEPVLQDRLPGNWKTVGTIDDVIVSRREAPSLPPPP